MYCEYCEIHKAIHRVLCLVYVYSNRLHDTFYRCLCEKCTDRILSDMYSMVAGYFENKSMGFDNIKIIKEL